MTGRGKGAKGLGKGGTHRHRRVVRDSISGITKPAIKRLAQRAGVKRISGLIYDEMRGVMKTYLTHILHESEIVMSNRGVKTLMVQDLRTALANMGINA